MCFFNNLLSVLLYHQCMALRNALMILIFPALMVVAGLVFTAAQPDVPWSLGAMLAYAPYFVAALAAIVGGWFKCPRMVLMATLIAGAHWVVQAFVAGVNIYDRGPEITVIYAGLAVLFPLNAALVAVKPDRGLLSLGVLSRVLFAALQIVALIVVWDAGESARTFTDDVLHTRVFDKDLDYWSLLPQPALLLFALVSAGLLARALWKGGVLDGGLFGAVAVSALALHAAGNGPLSSILFSLAAIVLLAAVGQESYRLAYIDELTGLPGRRALMHDLMTLSGAYTVAMLDVDHFKKFNDTYGHDVGDQVLKMVAGKMMCVTGGGRSYRYGGEEFTVLFAHKGVDNAITHLDKLRLAIEAASFKLRAQDRPKAKPEDAKVTKASGKKISDIVSVTISIGAAPSEDGLTPQDALKAADQALYRAKDGGRNRVSR